MKEKIILILVCIMLISTNKAAFTQKEINNSNNSLDNIYNQEKMVKYPLVFIHGIGGRIDFWDEVMNSFNPNYYQMGFLKSKKIYHDYNQQQKDYTVWGVTYYTRDIIQEVLNGDIDLYALRLSKIVQLIKELTGHDQVVLVAHSMGGLVARKYMSLNQDTWDSVHKILTVGTPHQGVTTSIGIVGQLDDLKAKSQFLQELQNDWRRLELNSDHKKWGVIGAIDLDMSYNFKGDPDATDSGGPGFVRISSSIPRGEWKEAVANWSNIDNNTDNFGFRLAIDATHTELLVHLDTRKGVDWALKDF